MTQVAQNTYRSGMIAIVGRPNVGKSTLLNRILEEKIAITSKTPQTTRHRILGVRTLTGAQLVLLDTPGIHKPKYRLNRRMVRTAWESIEGADLVLFLVEATATPGPGDRYIIQAIQKSQLAAILVMNKMDLIKKHELLPLIDLYRKEYSFAELIPVSALTGENVDHLIEYVVKYLPVGGPLYPEDTLTDQTMRALTSEIIREKILQKTREEIPYSVAIILDEFREVEDKNLTVIKATVLVERTSQKRIIIGEGGRLLKEVGQEARAELEPKLGRKVYLELWVKVKKHWRQDDRVLNELGY
jgi:GTPase